MKNARELAGKVDVTGDIGEAFDKRLAKLRNEVLQRQGGALALAKFAKQKAHTLSESIDVDKKSGDLAKLLGSTGWSGMPEDVKVAKYAKMTVDRLVGMVSNFAQLEKSLELVTNGKVLAMEEALELVQKHHVSSVNQSRQILAAAEEAKEAAKAEAAGKPLKESEPDSRRPKPHGTLSERRAEAAKVSEASKKVSKKVNKKVTNKAKAKK